MADSILLSHIFLYKGYLLFYHRIRNFPVWMQSSRFFTITWWRKVIFFCQNPCNLSEPGAFQFDIFLIRMKTSSLYGNIINALLCNTFQLFLSCHSFSISVMVNWVVLQLTPEFNRFFCIRHQLFLPHFSILLFI